MLKQPFQVGKIIWINFGGMKISGDNSAVENPLLLRPCIVWCVRVCVRAVAAREEKSEDVGGSGSCDGSSRVGSDGIGRRGHSGAAG